eukprot:UN20682
MIVARQAYTSNLIRVIEKIWGFSFLGRRFWGFFQNHSKGLYKDPNDSRNHPE